MKIFLKKKIVIGAILTALYFAVLFFTLSSYGTNWDEPNHYIRGQAYLRYFLTGQDNYDDLPKLKSHYPKVFGRALPSGITLENDFSFRRSLYQYSDTSQSLTFRWYLKNDFGHPPLNGILASFFNYIFYQKLGFMGDIQAYHLFIITITSLVVFTVFLFASSCYGIFAGIIAAFSIILYPLLFSESHFNIKDPVEMSFYTLSIIIFYIGITRKSWKWLLLTGIVAGLALGTKLNIVFVVFTIVPWIIIYKWKSISHFKWPFSKSITFGILTIPISALLILFCTWPYLWSSPLSNFLSFLSYYKTIGTTSYQNSNSFILGFNPYAVWWIIYITPLAVLSLSLFGIVYVLKKGFREKEKTSLLILFWFLIPIIRVTMPNAGIYGGVRQIMEYIPPMAILAGIGASGIVKLLHCYIVKIIKKTNNGTIKQLNNRIFLQMLIVFSFLPITLKLISIHPNENVYFNPLIGGLQGAKEKNFSDWGTTLGSAYKGGIDWINIHAEENSKLALVNGLLSNIPRVFIRDDIYFSESHYSGDKKQGEYLMEITDYTWNLVVPEGKRKYLETLMPIYEEKVDGVAILKIWKNDEKHTKEIKY